MPLFVFAALCGSVNWWGKEKYNQSQKITRKKEKTTGNLVEQHRDWLKVKKWEAVLSPVPHSERSCDIPQSGPESQKMQQRKPNLGWMITIIHLLK